MGDGRIPTSRASRAAKVGRLAATEAARHAGTHAANLARPPRKRRAALERRHLETADQILTVLGTMKGAAMKLGQMLSFVDLGVVPRDARPEFQRKLAALRDSAPQVPFARMMKVLEEDIGRSRAAVFAEFESEPIGVASIGQVYRATTKDGREVAVKVQYPGVAAAVRADMKNLALMMRLVQRALPGVDTEAVAREIRLRVGEELDYELEARNQREFAVAFRGHPFVVVPDGVPELCGQRVLVSDYVEGRSFEQLKDEEVQLTPEMATQALVESLAPQSTYFKTFRHQHLPSEHILARRLELFTQALLGQLRARANWHRIAREWLYGDAPVTELGVLEAEFDAGAPANFGG